MNGFPVPGLWLWPVASSRTPTVGTGWERKESPWRGWWNNPCTAPALPGRRWNKTEKQTKEKMCHCQVVVGTSELIVDLTIARPWLPAPACRLCFTISVGTRTRQAATWRSFNDCGGSLSPQYILTMKSRLREKVEKMRTSPKGCKWLRNTSPALAANIWSPAESATPYLMRRGSPVLFYNEKVFSLGNGLFLDCVISAEEKGCIGGRADSSRT